MPRTATPAAPELFAAPRGTRVVCLTLLPFALLGAASASNLWLATTLEVSPRAFWRMACAPAAGLVVILPLLAFSSVRGYRLEAGVLEVRRFFRHHRFPLAGLKSVELDSRALEGARKSLFGNAGAGAITGRWRSERLGEFEVLATDLRCGVVLRWPDRTLLISPDRPAMFAEAVRDRIKGRH